MTRIGRRSGRTRGSELGLETIVNANLGTRKRVTSLLSGTTTKTPASLEFTQGQTGMATIDTVQVTVAGLPATTAGLGGSLDFLVSKIEGGTILITEASLTSLNQDVRLFVTIVGRADPLRTGTVPQ
jgi:hypothetical protein